jgi:3',5'-cyclic AMP phosphodiesterase CpdA
MSKRLFGTLNWFFLRKPHFFPERLEPLPKLFTELGVDLVLLGGDFTTTALGKEYELASKFVAQIEQPWIAIPGNHDHYTYRSYRQKHFYRYFTNKKGKAAHRTDFFSLKDQGVEAHRISEGWWVLALDTAIATNPYSSKGRFSKRQEAYLVEMLDLIPKEDSILLLNHYPFFHHDEERRCLERGDALQEILKQDPRIKLYLHGHTHRNSIADLQAAGLPIVLDSGCPVQGDVSSWNLIDLTEAFCETTSYRWDGGWKRARVEKMAWKRP